jgi:hypothetical protein
MNLTLGASVDYGVNARTLAHTYPVLGITPGYYNDAVAASQRGRSQVVLGVLRFTTRQTQAKSLCIISLTS